MKSKLVLKLLPVKKKKTCFLIIQYWFLKEAISYKVMMKHVLDKRDIGNTLISCIFLINYLSPHLIFQSILILVFNII